MNVNNNAKINAICIIFLISTMLFAMFSLHILPYGDDHKFSNALSTKSLFEYLYMRYHTWTGRIPVEALIALTINIPVYWKIAIPTSFVILAYSISQLAGLEIKSKIVTTSFVAMLMLLVNHDVMVDAGWWVTGSYYYLQPIAAGLVSLVIFMKSVKFGVFAKIISLFLISFACFNEQFSIMVAVPIPLVYIVYRKDYNKYNIAYLATIILSTATSLLAPGNAARTSAEILRWMPDYVNLNIIDKLSIGFDRLSSHITEGNILFNLFLAALLFVNFKKSRMPLAAMCASWVVAFKIAVTFLQYLQSDQLGYFTNSSFLSFADIGDFHRFTPYIFSLLILFSALTLLINLCNNGSDYFQLALTFILAILSVVAIGFSPTAYASAFRVLFIFNIYIVYLIANLASRVLVTKIQ